MKMVGSTPTGRGRPYSYYVTCEAGGKAKTHITTSKVDSQLPRILASIGVSPERLADISRAYHDEVTSLRLPGYAERLHALEDRLERLNKELLSYARLHAKGGLSESEYLTLRQECQASITGTERDIQDLSKNGDEMGQRWEHVPALLAMLPFLFLRLDAANQKKVIQLIFRKIIIDDEGQIIRTELNPPFELGKLI